MKTTAFKNTYLSVSRIKRFESCPLSFKLHYIDKLRSEPNDALRFGSLLHTVLEQLYRWVIQEEHTGRLPEEHALELYREAWSRSGLSGFGIYQEGLDILKAYLREHAMVDHRDILAVEKEFRLRVGSYEVLGYIDRIDRIDDETIEVIDYKTNRLIFTRDEVSTDLQLTVYLMAVRELWPWAKKVRLVFHLLRHNMRMQTDRTDEQIDAAREYIVSIGGRTEGTDDFAPRLNPNCQYCDHRQHCPAYQEAVAGQVEVVKSSKGDLETIAREREQVANLAKILYARKAELERILKAQLEEQDTLELAGMVYRMSHSTQKSYPVESTLRVLREVAGLDENEIRQQLLVVDKAKVDALVRKLGKNMPRTEHRMLKTQLDAVADKSFTPRFYAKAT